MNELHQVPYYIIRVVLEVIIFTLKFVHHYVLQSTVSLEIHKLKKIFKENKLKKIKLKKIVENIDEIHVECTIILTIINNINTNLIIISIQITNIQIA